MLPQFSFSSICQMIACKNQAEGLRIGVFILKQPCVYFRWLMKKKSHSSIKSPKVLMREWTERHQLLHKFIIKAPFLKPLP